jgi:hypothetical protein
MNDGSTDQLEFFNLLVVTPVRQPCTSFILIPIRVVSTQAHRQEM